MGMKSLNGLIVAALLMTSAHSFAANDMCVNAGEAAKSIMRARQENTDMSSLMAIVEKQEDEAFKKVARQMVMTAYGQPAYQTEAMQQKAIAEFSNNVQLACYQGTNK
ncbi:hypothetical protein [Rhizobium brockwellii]